MKHGTHGRKSAKLSMYSQRKNDLKPLDWIVDRTKIAHDKRRAEYIKHATSIYLTDYPSR